jgi:hypothetical protein
LRRRVARGMGKRQRRGFWRERLSSNVTGGF